MIKYAIRVNSIEKPEEYSYMLVDNKHNPVYFNSPDDAIAFSKEAIKFFAKQGIIVDGLDIQLEELSSEVN